MTIVHPFKLILSCAIILLLAACGKSSKVIPAPLPQQLPPPPSVVVVDYQNVIDELVSADIPGIILLVETPQNRFIGSAGVSNLQTQQAMQVDDTIPTASVGKK